jgi:hypothetical protein
VLYGICSTSLNLSTKPYNFLCFYYIIMMKINHHTIPFVLISIAFILLHISQCSGQQSWRQVTFIELQAKHQTSLGAEKDDMIFDIGLVSCII